MKTNRVARRILGLPYNLSRSKKKVRFSIIASTNAENVPAELKNATKVCLKQDFRKKAAHKHIYMKLTDAYPEYLATN
ncbi:stationary-phase-induced ribosome-associated protein [Proteus alimentorum]|uniref:Stationary-phase-induced ribosome-associated protein n=1 Tax=Proteus alimentorum TaxID=1973495 RepID=A0ABS0IQ49_9GAMM|nr:stationary-phase-induced ribosome-associated protein [Proteus alimentorum]MBG2878115.1 stationary-phase-induced ribosome-associated protein [Proteus alimentorum]